MIEIRWILAGKVGRDKKPTEQWLSIVTKVTGAN
jgi:hypothetical protein